MNKWIFTACIIVAVLCVVSVRSNALSFFTVSNSATHRNITKSLTVVKKDPEIISYSSASTNTSEALTDEAPILQGFLAPNTSANKTTTQKLNDVSQQDTKISPLPRCPQANTLQISAFLFPMNKTFSLDTHYVPEELVQIPNDRVKNNGFICVTKQTFTAMQNMFDEAKEEGYILYSTSGFRSGKTQESLFAYYVNSLGLNEAERRSARPGHSEHQLGTTIDITGGASGATSHNFGETVEGMWLSEHAHEYGFVMSYEKDKEVITGYMYEPWHFRYVGPDIANAIIDKNTTLGEFLIELYTQQ
ncbi:MAG: M15 family metallopeptidase [Candidatus Pacebacteria bacterium]|nr:M15 family metallopeptidase [Candidatus Paceibacterota bacterium]